MNLTIKKKMIGTVGISILFMASVVVILLIGFAKIEEQKAQMEKYAAINTFALRGNIAMLKAREYEAEYFNRHHEKWVDRVKKSVDDVNVSLNSIDKINDIPKVKELTDKARKVGKQYVTRFAETAEKARVSNFNPAATADDREELLDVVNEFEPLLDNYIPKLSTASFQVAKKELDAVEERTRIIILAVIIFAAFLQALLMTLITRQIIREVKKVVDGLQGIAQGEGDLTKRLEQQSRDEIGDLCFWFNTFVDKLHGIISQVAQNSVHVAASANELYANAEQMATGIEVVAGQTSTVATAGEEMTSTSSDIARNCIMAADGSKRANDSALSGTAVVEETVQGMGRIASRVRDSARTVESLGARSDQIGAIIGTIEDIADQTNLLALNAAIEAARAGDQGRGFAVVADEVRALAERTTRATREIGDMIKAIQSETRGAVTAMEEGVKEVEKGTNEAARSGEALKDILAQINNVTLQVNQIAVAAEEQTATTYEISNNIQQITGVVSETARGAQESAGAASRLAGLAEELQRLVGQFKLA
jgi:methyl-accepting chemotaxis protein